MTALAGMWRLDGRPDAADSCARMLSSQQIYGPDAAGRWSGGEIAVGRQLKRMLPEDAFDRQPLRGGGGRYVLVADLRLDNRDELISSLRVPAPHDTLCDAAILLAAIERWGDRCVERLVGDYAFALWDVERRQLHLVRDPLGQRPLHYHRGGGFFAFASMPKGLHALPEVPYAADEDRVAELVVLMPEYGPRTFFRGIERVEPGQIATVTAGGLSLRSHWQPPATTLKLRTRADYADALREHLDRAVRCRLRGAGETVGSGLSGGFDSGAVTATAARLMAASGGRVVAFTAVPREGFSRAPSDRRLLDEGPLASATASLYPNVEHVLIRSEGRSPLDGLDRSFFLFEQPGYNLCNVVWASSINDAARQRNLTVVLNGQSGNMTLSYDGMELLPELFLGGRWMHLFREMRGLVRRRRLRWRGVLARTFGAWCPSPVWMWLNKVVLGEDWDVANYTAISTSRLTGLDLHAMARRTGLDFAYRPWKDGVAMRLWVLRRSDPGNSNKGILAGWGIDSRDPTADLRLLEFCLSVPTEFFLTDGVTRALARHALTDRLPAQVLDNVQAGVQAADWHEGLSADRDRVATEIDRIAACPGAARSLNILRLKNLVANWPSSGWERRETIYAYRQMLLRAVDAGHFLRRASGANN
jgi:asparagine synthase (glutamine-hydrolysing)